MTRNQELYLELRKKNGARAWDAHTQDQHDRPDLGHYLSAAWHKLTISERRELLQDWQELAPVIDTSYPSP